MAGTGLPIPKNDNVLVQPPPVIDAARYSNAQMWGQIAAAGAKIAGAAQDSLALAEHQAQVGYLSGQEVEINRKRTELRDQHAFDPAGFDAAWKGYTEGKLSEAQPWAVDRIKRSLGSEGNAAYGAILGEKRGRDQRLDGERVANLAATSGNDVIGAGMAGTLASPDGQVKVAKYRSVLDSGVTAGLHTKEWADYHFDDTMSKAQGEEAARSGVQVYREKGFDAAVDHLKKSILENEGLTLKGESKYKAFSRGLSAIRLQQAADKEDREGVITVSKDIRARLDSNQPVDPGEIRDTLTGLRQTGAAAEHHKLTVSSAVQEATAPYRSGLNLREFASAVAGQRMIPLADAVKRFEGFTPTAKWDYRQHSVGYGTRATGPGETVDRATADARLNVELGKAAAIVDQVNPNLPAGARDAMISLTFNAGADWVGAGLGERIRAGDMEGAKKLFTEYNKAGGQTNEALVKRRAEEVQWFDRGGPSAGGVGPVGMPHAGEITQRVQKVFVAQAKAAWPEFKSLIDRGKVLDEDDFNSIRYAAALSGDAVWQQQVEALGIANNIGQKTRDLPQGQRQAALDQTAVELKKSGLPVVDQDAIQKSLEAQFERQNKMVRDDPIGYSIERGGKAPDPLDFSSAPNLRAGIEQRVAITRGVAADQQVAPGTPFRASDRATLAGAISAGTPERAAVALDALGSLPDEMLTPALHSPEIKNAVAGAARSSEGGRYNAAMQFLDRVWARAPETAKHLFGEDSIHSLMTWQSNLRYMSPEQLAKERERAAVDPQVRERRKVNEEAGRTLARKEKFEDVVGQFDSSWWVTPGPIARLTGSQPLPPTDAMTRDAFMGDFETLFARRYSETLDKDVAMKQSVELMKTKWTASPVNGGKLMLNAPETLRGPDGTPIYPAVGGSHDWMKTQLEADIEKNVGRPMRGAPDPTNLSLTGAENWTYTMVSDRQTQSEAQNGRPASYVVVLTDPATGKASVLPQRWAADPTEARAKARTDFAEQRARFKANLDALPSLGQLPVP